MVFNLIQKALAVIVGSLFIAIGINFFAIPHHLLDGGMIGLGLIGKYAFDFPPGLTIILLSFPLYIIAFYYNRDYFYNGVHGLLVSSFLIDFFRSFPLDSSIPIWISSICAGIMIGIGISIMLVNNISTGGSDLLALILANLTTINVGLIILLLDSLVILFGSIVIPETKIFYSAIVVTVGGCTTFIVTSYFKPKKTATKE